MLNNLTPLFGGFAMMFLVFWGMSKMGDNKATSKEDKQKNFGYALLFAFIVVVGLALFGGDYGS